jgi:nicotinate-nucleotide adenylyltransferase
MSNERFGIMGGSFNPIHIGHINSAQTVAKQMGLKKVFLIPTNVTPNRPELEGPSAEQRLKMVEIASRCSDLLEADDREIKRGGTSYTSDTIRDFNQSISPENLFFITGLDVFYGLDAWKDPDAVLKGANLVVTTRPGELLPASVESLPKTVRDQLAEYELGKTLLLKSGRMVNFVRLQDVEISSTQIRKALRREQNVDKFLDLDVERYIKENDLYPPFGEKIDDYEKLVQAAGHSIVDMKGISPQGYFFDDNESLSEYTVIASGTSTRHAQAIADKAIAKINEDFAIKPICVEGLSEGRWIVVDYGALIIHVFYDFVREQYRLEDLWQKGKRLKLG